MNLYKLVRMEWMKLNTRRNIVFTLIVLVLVTLQVAFAVRVELAEPAGYVSAPIIYEHAFRYISNIAFTFIPILLLVNVSKEFEYAVVHRSLVSGLSRKDFYFSKLMLMAAFSVLAPVAASIFTLLTAVFYDISLIWDYNKLLMYFPVAFCLGSFSFLLVLLLKRSIYSLAAFIAYVLMENALHTIIPDEDILRFLPFQTCAQILRHKIYDTTGVAMAAIYTIIFLVAGYWRFTRMDLQ